MRKVVPKRRVRLAEPVEQHAVLGHAVHHAVGADDGRIDRAGENQHAHDHHEDVETAAAAAYGPARCMARPPSRLSTYSWRGLSGIIMPANTVMTPVQTTAYTQTMLPVIAQVLQLRVGDFAVHLRQRFKSAHGEQRVPEGDDDGDAPDLRPEWCP